MIFNASLSDFLPPGVFAALGQQITQQVLQNIADGARDCWIQAAQRELKRSQSDYINGIQLDVKPGIATLTLNGTLPNQIEKGMPAADLHDVLLGDKVPVVERGSGQPGKIRKKSGAGWYRVIPFRHASSTSGFASGVPMGRAYQGHNAVADVKALGRVVNAAAKKLSATTAGTGGKLKYGQALPEGLAPKLKSTHAVDIYAGMIKSSKQYRPQGRMQNQYLTFRTISTGSPGWYRAPVEGKHLLKQVGQYVGRIAPLAFAEFVKESLGP